MYAIEATNQFGCSSSDEILVTLTSCASLEEITNSIQLYPNPTLDFVQITSTEQLGMIRLFSSEGKLVFEQNASENEVKISLLDFSPGVYTLQIDNHWGLNSQRIIKQ